MNRDYYTQYMTIQFTETDKYYFVRKPHGIPTTFGSQFSYVEKIVSENPPFFASLTQHFSADEEYGLLNRLDNDTAGFLYFAKTKNIKKEYKKLQDEQMINKLYIANLEGRVDVERTAEKHEELRVTEFYLRHPEWNEGSRQKTSIPWDSSALPQNDGSIINYALWTINLSQQEIDSITNVFKWHTKWLVITYPIMHHIHDDIRMVAIRIPKDYNKWRGEKHRVETTLFPIQYNEEDNTTLCLITIHQGIRHQIRVHCDSVWYPVAKDKLYGKWGGGWDLQLWSIGIL